MKQLEVNKLIDRYFSGESSEEEENVLKDYLKNNNDEQYNDLRLQFQVMNDVFDSENKLDDSFDNKIMQEITKSAPSKTKHYNILRIVSGIAATVLIFVSIWATTNILGPKEVYGTINDPKVAFAEAKMILQKVSGNVKKGIKPATKAIKKGESGLNKTKKAKNLKNLNNVNLLLKSMTKVTVKYGKS